MKVALVQMFVVPGEARRNLCHALDLVAEAARRGADVILLPEALPFGWMESGGANDANEALTALRERARRHSKCICSGLVEVSGAQTFNSAVLIDTQGEVILRHRKINELEIAQPCYTLGDRLGVVDTPHGRLGLMICADAFARGQVISRTLGYMGAELILSPCAWAVPPDHDNVQNPYGALWLDNYGPVARDFGLWIAGCSNIGPIRSGPWAGHRCIGCSLVVGSDGQSKAQGRYDLEEILLVEVNLAPQRARGTAWEHEWQASRPKIDLGS